MEKIRLNNGTVLEFTNITDTSNQITLSFQGLELPYLRDLLDEPSNLSSIEVLTEGGVICAAYEGYNKVDRYIITDDEIQVVIMKPNEIMTKVNQLEENNAMLTECILEMSEMLYNN